VRALALGKGQLFSGSDDNTVRVWNAEDGSALRLLKGHKGRITCLHYDKGQDLLFSGAADRSVLAWSAEV
jgi:WD40 repeat protein